MYDTYMSTPGNTAKLGTAHINIQTSSSSSFNVLLPLWGLTGDGFPPFVSVLRCVLFNSQVLHILLDASPPALLWSSHRSSAWYLHPHCSSHGAILYPSLHMAKPSQSVPPQFALDVFQVTSPQHLLTWYSVLPSDTSHVPQHPPVCCPDHLQQSNSQRPCFRVVQ